MTALARLLAEDAEVTIVTSDAHRAAHEAAPLQLGRAVRVLFAREPAPEATGHLIGAQAWSAALWEAIAAGFAGTTGPDLIEFPDYLAEGFVTLQARRTGAPLLARTRIVVRCHTTAEVVSVLNGALDDGFGTRVLVDMERYCLRHADALLAPDPGIRSSYQRYYGAEALAPGSIVPDAFEDDFAPVPAGERAPGGPVRFLFLGRLERRKGPQRLVRALRGLEHANWEASFLGGDTDTGPVAVSMRTWLQQAAGDDGRISWLDPVPRRAVGAVIAAHDVVVIPSLWECWPNVAREALRHGRPILAAPVGGLPGLVEDGATGWLAPAPSVAGLGLALDRLLADPEAVFALRDAPALRAAADTINDPGRTRAAYRALLPPAGRPPAAAPAGTPRVSVVVPYFRMAAHVAATVASVRAQGWSDLEVVVVNDGSFQPEDREALDALGVRVVTQANRGLGAARNLGVAVTTGAYVLPLDADNLLLPRFLERAVAVLEADPELAFVTTWSRHIDDTGAPLPGGGDAPLGNWAASTARDNVAGDGTALLRRSIFDAGHRWDEELTSFEDWFFYRRLAEQGIMGDVLPERLFAYRVRADSMLRTHGLERVGRISDEMRARRLEPALTGEAAR